MTAQMDIEVPRNGDWFRTSQLVDDAGDPIDLTGHTLALQIRAAAGDGPLLATGTITIEPSNFGIFDELITGASLTTVAGVNELVRLAYDLRRTDPTGIITIERRGAILYAPGVTT